MATPRRGGLRTPAMTPSASLEHVPGRPPALRLPLGGHAIPRLASGLATRTHGVRPSEKTASRVIPGFAPLGRPSSDGHPVEGRAPHAREGRRGLDRGMCSLAHRLIVNHPVGMGYPGLRPALPRRRTECVPPRRPPLALSPGLPR
jgi:hypothetical protein